MLHSTLISEPTALTTGVASGLVGYLLLAALGLSHESQLFGAVATSVVANFCVGAPINAMALDALSLLLVRPASAFIGAKLVQGILS